MQYLHRYRHIFPALSYSPTLPSSSLTSPFSFFFFLHSEKNTTTNKSFSIVLYFSQTTPITSNTYMSACHQPYHTYYSFTLFFPPHSTKK
eukprot:UN03497